MSTSTYHLGEDADHLPSYSSRRSSYSQALSHVHNETSSSRKASDASCLNSFQPTPPSPPPSDVPYELCKHSSSDNLTSPARVKRKCSARKYVYIIAMLVTLLASIALIIGICLLVSTSNVIADGDSSPLKSLGYFFTVLGLLIILLSMSIIFTTSKQTSTRKNAHPTSVERPRSANLVAPEIRVTSDQPNKFPMKFDKTFKISKDGTAWDSHGKHH